MIMKKNNLIAVLIMTAYCTNLIASSHEQTKQSWAAYFASLYASSSESNTIPLAKDAGKNAVIFDVDGVLTTTNYLKAAPIIGYEELFNYVIAHPLNLPSPKILYQALEDCPAVSTYPASRQGKKIPAIMIDWKTGAQSLDAVQKAMIKHISTSNMSQSEKKLFINIALMMTTPEKLTAIRDKIDGIESLLHELKRKDYKLYILSNGESGSFQLTKQKLPELFTYQGQEMFDGIMLASDQQKIKPNPEMFQNFLEKFKIKPSQAVFIDDSVENVQAAQNLGISSIFCKKENIAQVEKDLKNIFNTRS
jgi:HAD superfamily hydrolase (TIGR01549 family)